MIEKHGGALPMTRISMAWALVATESIPTVVLYMASARQNGLKRKTQAEALEHSKNRYAKITPDAWDSEKNLNGFLYCKASIFPHKPLPHLSPVTLAQAGVPDIQK